MKRILSLLFACLCLLTASSCRRKENKDSLKLTNQNPEQTERTDVLTNVYRGTVMTLPDDWGKSYRYRMAATVPGIDPETGTVTVYAEDGEFRGHILTWSAESGVTGEKEVPFPEGHEYMAGVFDGGIFRYVTARIEGEPPVQDCAELNVSSMDLETGEVSVSANLRPLFSTADMQQFGLNVSSFAVDADGDLWLESRRVCGPVQLPHETDRRSGREGLASGRGQDPRLRQEIPAGTPDSDSPREGEENPVRRRGIRLLLCLLFGDLRSEDRRRDDRGGASHELSELRRGRE